MKTFSLLLALVSAASLSVVVLAPTNSFAQTFQQRRAAPAPRARVYRPVAPQARPQRPSGQRFSGGNHVDRQNFAQSHPDHENGRRNFYIANQVLIDEWIAANDILYVHAQNADGTAAGDASDTNWDAASADALQNCIDNADSAGVDDSSCQITNTSIAPPN